MQIGVFEAKNRLSELLERAAQGEDVVITKHGRPLAKLTAVRRAMTPEEIEGLIARVRERREQLQPVTWEELKRDRDAGRRF
ncbi:MAG TPA: type II toxin-antitoxin system prevent-host-death family antitoxin [Caulobacteraceae bacterium]